MSRTHELKTWPIQFAALLDGSKTFEARKDDRGIEVGDTLRLREFKVGTQEYTGREITRTVTYALRDQWFVRDGFVILALSPAAALPEVTPAMIEDLRSAGDVELRESDLAVIWRENVPKVLAVLEAVAALRRPTAPSPEDRGPAS